MSRLFLLAAPLLNGIPRTAVADLNRELRERVRRLERGLRLRHSLERDGAYRCALSQPHRFN